MIRYPFNVVEVRNAIMANDPTWFVRGRDRTEGFIRKGSYSEKSSIWSNAKAPFIDLQHRKCAFCERQFEGTIYGRIEHDVEHFRPKAGVDLWPPTDARSPLVYAFPTGVSDEKGYYWLPYSLLNYVGSCKVCNSILKRNYFPICDKRVVGEEAARLERTPIDLLVELPLLCYPLGNWDDDPEDLITFDATVAVPRHRSGHKNRRGQVIIDFFRLNKREQLHIERARMITIFGPVLAKQNNGKAMSPNEAQVLAKLSKPWLPHASCLRAFARTYASDPIRGAEIYDRCLGFAV